MTSLVIKRLQFSQVSPWKILFFSYQSNFWEQKFWDLVTKGTKLRQLIF